MLCFAHVATAQAPAAQGLAAPEVKVVATKLGGNVYGIDGQGGRMAALVGPTACCWLTRSSSGDGEDRGRDQGPLHRAASLSREHARARRSLGRQREFR
jgi:hypothetical protein